MRHNNNGRRFRGRDNRNGGGGGHQGNHTNHSGGNGNVSNGGGGGGNNNRRMNPRMQTFDSNGPDVRIRGNAYQIHEKYVTLARDAMSSGDPVLAESYQQHSEHYQRMINEMTEEYNKYNPQPQFQPQQQQPITGDEPQPELSVEQPSVVAAQQQQQQHNQNQQPSQNGGGNMEDLDQSFLRGPRTKEVETA
jgi:hypothetical protein